MLIPKKISKTILKYLFKEGVVVAKKDTVGKHPEIDVPNLYVIKLMQSLKSKGYVAEKFNWWYFYWHLTNDGMEYLRDFLSLPESIVPATLKPQARAQRAPQAQGQAPAKEGQTEGTQGKTGAPAGRGYYRDNNKAQQTGSIGRGSAPRNNTNK